MKRILSILFFIFVYALPYAQVNLSIDIVVLDMERNTPVDSCPLILKTDSGKIYQFQTDSLGFFHYHNGAATFKKCTLFTQTNRFVKTKYALLGFLASEDRIQVDLSGYKPNESVELAYSFRLKPIAYCGPLSEPFVFQKNSIQFDTAAMCRGGDSAWCLPQNVLKHLVATLKLHTGMIVEISAHASADEKYPAELAQMRGEKIKLLLVQNGIAANRLKVLSHGITRLKITDTQIRKAKTQEEKAALHAINRRCIFKVLDYGPED